jgi:hypothetical protein
MPRMNSDGDGVDMGYPRPRTGTRTVYQKSLPLQGIILSTCQVPYQARDGMFRTCPLRSPETAFGRLPQPSAGEGYKPT